MSKKKKVKASDCQCCVCGQSAVAFWPVIDPDIPANPYCRPCLDKAQQELLIEPLIKLHIGKKNKSQQTMSTHKPSTQFHGSDDEKRASALVTMNYITMSICNAYAEEVKDILEQYGLYRYDTKQESEFAIRAFDRYHNAMKKFFKGEPLAQKQLIEVYEIVKKNLDENVLESIAQYNRKQEEQV